MFKKTIVLCTLFIFLLFSTAVHANELNKGVNDNDIYTLTVSLTALSLSVIALIKAFKKNPEPHKQSLYPNKAQDITKTPSNLDYHSSVLH